MHPLRRLGSPSDVARTALFLASEAASWLTGITIDVAGGRITSRTAYERRTRPQIRSGYSRGVDPRLRFDNPPALPHEVVAELVERALRDRSAEDEAAEVLVGAALNDDDAQFVERWCVEVAKRGMPGSPLLGLAGLCLGHAARRFGRLSDEALALAESLAARADADPADVDGRALDGYDDVRSFLHLW